MNHFDHPADLATPPRPRGPLLGARLVERRPDSCADFESQAHRDEPAWPAWLVAVLIAAAFVLAPMECFVRGAC
jgi:hypothetical protein